MKKLDLILKIIMIVNVLLVVVPIILMIPGGINKLPVYYGGFYFYGIWSGIICIINIIILIFLYREALNIKIKLLLVIFNLIVTIFTPIYIKVTPIPEFIQNGIEIYADGGPMKEKLYNAYKIPLYEEK